METENTLPYNGLIISRTRSDAILSLLMLKARALKDTGIAHRANEVINHAPSSVGRARTAN